MSLSYNNLTFIIVTYKSEKIIIECLNSLPKNIPIIIIENSANQELKKKLEENFKNIEVIIENNKGMGSSNNIGLKSCKTDYAFVINPDVQLKVDTIDEMIKVSEEIHDYAILAPVVNKLNFKKHKLLDDNLNNNHDNYLRVKQVEGSAMLFNLKKFKDLFFFDENFFLYLEDIDICLRKIKEGEKIFVAKKAFVNHLGGGSADKKFKEEIEYSRNWHWMWSKYYFNKKHYGFVKAILGVSLNLLTSLFKFALYSIFLNKYKSKIYYMRMLGILNSVMGKNSWYRPKL